jgi:RNA polymerase sigma-70 factor (ECF subfamily)
VRDDAGDKELVRSSLQGDDLAFAKLLRRYERGLYNVAVRMVRDPESARDLTQEIMVRVHSSLGRYDPVYPFSAWIYRVASNLCIDFLRKRKLETISLDAPHIIEGEEVARELPDPSANPAHQLEERERARILEETLAKLPHAHRLVLVLRHQRDLSYEEIALALDAPLGTVKARIHRAREEFRRLLSEDVRWREIEGEGSRDVGREGGL